MLNSAGSGNFSDVADGLDWVIDNHLTLGIKVVNLSLGDLLVYDDSSAFPCTGSNTADAIAQLKDLGISVFVASGNGGFDNGIAASPRSRASASKPCAAHRNHAGRDAVHGWYQTCVVDSRQIGRSAKSLRSIDRRLSSNTELLQRRVHVTV